MIIDEIHTRVAIDAHRAVGDIGRDFGALCGPACEWMRIIDAWNGADRLCTVGSIIWLFTKAWYNARSNRRYYYWERLAVAAGNWAAVGS